MIDFTSTQLSWIVVSMATIGGTGYVSMNQKIDDLDKKLAVVINSASYNEKAISELKTQLDRIELKISKSK